MLFSFLIFLPVSLLSQTETLYVRAQGLRLKECFDFCLRLNNVFSMQLETLLNNATTGEKHFLSYEPQAK